MGMVTVDASLEKRDKSSNAIAMKKVLKDFLQGKINLFIFPEGNFSSFQEMPLRERLQTGIADFILKTLVVNKSVRIVPIKINYNSEKNCLGEITIKKPIRFYQDKNINFEEQSSILLPQNKESFGKILDIIADNIS